MDARRENQIREEISKEIAKIGIPPRPLVIQEIENELKKDMPDLHALEAIISRDVGISAGLLKVANSPFFGFGGRVRSVKDAIHVIGLNIISSAVAGLALKRAFEKVPNLERFWDASGRIAQISGWLTTKIRIKNRVIKPQEVFTFGLFRDCGIPLLMFNFSDYIDVLKAANNALDRLFTEVEDEELGFNHAMIGAKLVREWGMPEEFAVGVNFHHDADAIDGTFPITPEISRIFISISQLAEFLFQNKTNLSHTREWEKLAPSCLENLGLSEEDMDALQADMLAELADIRSQ